MSTVFVFAVNVCSLPGVISICCFEFYFAVTVVGHRTLPCDLMKFSISALNSGTQNCLFLCFRRLPEQTRMQKYAYSNFANFNPRAFVNTSCVAK